MYKYTYMLSQSYRTDTSNFPNNKASASTTNLLPHQTLPYSSSNFKNHSQSHPTQHGQNQKHNIRSNSRKGIETIEVKQYKPNDISKHQPNRIDISISQTEPHEKVRRVQQISEKYCHHPRPSLPQQKGKEIQHGQKVLQFESYASHPRKTEQFIKISDQPPFYRPKTQQSQNLEAMSQGQNIVSRSKIRSQIAVHLQKSKANKELSTGKAIPQKYNSNVSRPIPSREKEGEGSAQSSGTVAKLTSLQQRIKWTVEPYIHF